MDLLVEMVYHSVSYDTLWDFEYRNIYVCELSNPWYSVVLKY